MIRTVRRTVRRAVPVVMLCWVLAIAPGRAARDAVPGPEPAAAAHAVVVAVNALAPTDIAIDAARCVACPLDRLPTSRADLLRLLPPDHRRLIGECARGRTRVKHRAQGFDLRGLIDCDTGASTAAGTVDRFFAGRTVDVATGTGLSDEPYPLAFDWAVVLDPRTGTLFSFVLNCRD